MLNDHNQRDDDVRVRVRARVLNTAQSLNEKKAGSKAYYCDIYEKNK